MLKVEGDRLPISYSEYIMKVVITNLLLCCFIFLSSCSVQKAKDSAKGMDVYILMGQSNMAGRGELTQENQKIGNPRVVVFTEDLDWKEAHHPLHFDKPKVVGVGPGLSFGLAMIEENSRRRIGLVPTAVGGTSIDAWVPGGKDPYTGKYPYDDAAKRIKEAMKYGTIKGVLWLQGESDSQPEKVKDYLPKLEALIERVRGIVGNEKLPFIAGELGQFKKQYQSFNLQLPSLASTVPYTGIVSSDGLTDKGDSTHYDASSAIEMGKRFAVEMIKLQKKVK